MVKTDKNPRSGVRQLHETTTLIYLRVINTSTQHNLVPLTCISLAIDFVNFMPSFNLACTKIIQFFAQCRCNMDVCGVLVILGGKSSI